MRARALGNSEAKTSDQVGFGVACGLTRLDWLTGRAYFVRAGLFDSSGVLALLGAFGLLLGRL